MNTTREVVAPAMRAAAEDLCGDGAERLFTSDTRDLMAFFVILKKLLREVRPTCYTQDEQKLTWHSAVFTTSHSPISTSQRIID